MSSDAGRWRGMIAAVMRRNGAPAPRPLAARRMRMDQYAAIRYGDDPRVETSPDDLDVTVNFYTNVLRFSVTTDRQAESSG